MDLSISEEGSFTFGPFLFRPDHQVLLRGDKEVKLGSRAVSILHLLVTRSRTLVSKDELIAHAWPSTTVDEANLKVHICTLRRVLGDTRGHTEYIATVPGRGYQFIAPVLMTSAKAAGGSYDIGASQQGLPAEFGIVGRDREIEDVVSALASASVVTLAGPIGVGKASVARVAAAAVRSRFHGGCYVVDFSSMDDLSAVPNIVAAALGLRSVSTDMTGALADYLEHHDVLIVLDHCERVMSAVRLMISRLTASPHSSAFLLVSLEPLRVPNESVHRIGLLPFPSPDVWSRLSVASALTFPAIAMFVDRANAMSGYRLLECDVPSIAAMCHIMDGRPRSIVSALTNLLAHFSLDKMVGMVTRRVLDGPQPGEPDDPFCLMSGATDFGYGRLSADEATLLRRLSVFEGAFELEDVVRMVAPLGWDAHQTFMVLSNVIAKSLIWVEPLAPLSRYRILGAERFFGRARLREDQSEMQEVRARHAQVILQVFEQAQAEWSWIEPEAWRDRYEMRNEDLIEAIEWSSNEGADADLGVKLTSLAMCLWDEQPDLRSRTPYLARALTAGKALRTSSDAMSRIATSHAWSLTLSGELGDGTERAWANALQFAEESKDVVCQFSAIREYCHFLAVTGRSRFITFKLPELEELARRAKDHRFDPDVERFRSYMVLDAGNLESAIGFLRTAAGDLDGISRNSQAGRHRWFRYVTTHSALSLVEFITGPSDEPPPIFEELEELVRTCHPQGHALFLIMTALPIAFWRRDHRKLDELVAAFEAHKGADKIQIWNSTVRFYAAASRHLQNRPGSFYEMQEMVEQILVDGLHRRAALHLSMVAEAALENGRPDLATELIERALRQQERCQELWCAPEIKRIEAKVLYALGDPRKAQQRLRTAADDAAAMGAAFFSRRIEAEASAARMTTGGGEKLGGTGSIGSRVDTEVLLQFEHIPFEASHEARVPSSLVEHKTPLEHQIKI